VAKQAIPQTEIETIAAPTNYRELVALFAEKREGQLHGQLYANVYPVRCEPGVLEIRVGAQAPANLASNLAKCLTQWTGQRWMVSVSAAAGAPTLAEQDKAAGQKRQEKALAHPLVQAVTAAFPGAKLASLRQKVVAPVIVAGDDDTSDEPVIED
jgi:DNA polymerase-3 subunit gamma/tau